MCFAETAEFGRRKSIEAKCIQEELHWTREWYWPARRRI